MKNWTEGDDERAHEVENLKQNAQRNGGAGLEGKNDVAVYAFTDVKVAQKGDWKIQDKHTWNNKLMNYCMFDSANSFEKKCAR